MKKFSGPFILAQAAVIYIIGCIISIFIGIYSENVKHLSTEILDGDFLISVFETSLFISIFLCCFYIPMSNIITGKLAEKTINKTEEYNSNTFYTNNSIIRIYRQTGKIVYVANQNPFKLQVISAKDISNVRTYYIKGPFGGTRYVCFEFIYQNKRVRIPTFTSRNMYSMESEEVLTALSKADTFCEILENAKRAAIGGQMY